MQQLIKRFYVHYWLRRLLISIRTIRFASKGSLAELAEMADATRCNMSQNRDKTLGINHQPTCWYHPNFGSQARIYTKFEKPWATIICYTNGTQILTYGLAWICISTRTALRIEQIGFPQIQQWIRTTHHIQTKGSPANLIDLHLKRTRR